MMLECLPPYGKCCVVGCEQSQSWWVGANGIDDYTIVCADHVEDVKRDGDVIVRL